MEPGGWLATVAHARRTRPAESWAALIALFVLALATRTLFAQALNPAPFTPFFLALLASSVICGWRKSLGLLVVSAIVGWTFYAARPLAIAPSFDVRVVAFLIGGGCAIALIEGLMQTVAQLDATAKMNRDLFGELQHRVANNFQIVAATLEKARRAGIADRGASDAIDAAIARIQSLSRLHRRLYDPESYTRGLEPILREVLAETFYGVDVDLTIEADTGPLSVDEMISLVLFVNEAAINAAKHVFRPNRGHRFTVSLKSGRSGRTLLVRDDGPGFAATTVDPDRPRYGVTVMRGLATQLRGALQIDERGAGATIELTF